jgi:hypothetical protein
MRKLLLAAVLCVSQHALSQAPFEPGRASFSLGLNNEIYPYHDFATYVLPNERIVLRILDEGEASHEVTVPTGRLEQTEPRRFVWIAPQTPGSVEMTVASSSGDTISLNIFVRVPASRVRDGTLNGYQIGRYPTPPIDDPLYAVPAGYIEVHETDLQVSVSPHFALGQFVSDRSDTYPKYIVLRERLLLKLEALLERVNQLYSVNSFAVLSGYRTPAHNQAVGGSPYSRHIYGGAAAIIVDRDPIDGLMDDLNGDGGITQADAAVLFDIADVLFREPNNRYLQGGLATYGPTPWRGPYLHVDARGSRARWTTDQDRQRLQDPREPRHRRDFPRRQ